MRETHDPLIAPPWRRLALSAGFAVAFMASLAFSLSLTMGTSGVAAVWMSSGVLAAAFLLLPRHWGLGVAAVCVTFNLGMRLAVGDALPAALIFPLLNLGEAMAAAWLTRRICGGAPRLTSLKRVVRLIVLAVAPATAASAVAAADVLSLLGYDFNEVLSTWFYSHGLGTAIVLPSILLILRRDRLKAFQRVWYEPLGLYALVAVICAAGFMPSQFPTPLLVFPTLTLIAFRLGPKGSAVAALIVATLSAALVVVADGPMQWTFWSMVERTRSLQVLIAAGFLTSLTMALAVADQKRLKQLWATRTRIARAAEGRAVQANHAKAEFLATMSHEIRTPMNSIVGFTEVLLRRDDLPDAARRQLTLIDRAGASLLTVVNDILDFSKMEAGEVELSPRATTARAVAQDALAIVAEAARRKGVELQLALVGPVEAPVMLDDLRARQVLLNLLTNAIKFTAAGRVSLHLLATETDTGLTLKYSVVDTGPGIPSDKLDRLFKRFSQVDSSVSRTHAGTGLGLAICKGLSEVMGGRIGVESQEGVGSTFWFEIPAPLTEQPAVARAAADAPAVSRALNARVLLVDDHPVNLELGATVLRLLGCQVELAESGAEAVEAARVGACDLILMDVHMPLMDGLEATRRIRALGGAMATIPILAMSADVMPEMRAACLKAGMNDSVGKPISIADLHGALTRWLGDDAKVRAA